MIESHVQVKTRCALETFQVQEHVLDVRDRIGLPFNALIQHTKIVDEAHGPILLPDDKAGRYSLGVINLLENSYLN